MKGDTKILTDPRVVSLTEGCFRLEFTSPLSGFHEGDIIETYLQQGDHVEFLGVSHPTQIYSANIFDSIHFTADQLKKLGFQPGEATFTTDITDPNSGELLKKVIKPATLVEGPAPTNC